MVYSRFAIYVFSFMLITFSTVTQVLHVHCLHRRFHGLHCKQAVINIQDAKVSRDADVTLHIHAFCYGDACKTMCVTTNWEVDWDGDGWGGIS